MFAKNVPLVLEKIAQISESARVLDVGAWGSPVGRADVVVDIMPYETRGDPVGCRRGEERFTQETWLHHDISSRTPLPFPDKSFDFVVCSHVLEDIRDPIGLCAEMLRVGKAGYIEVPSRTVESIMGYETPGYVGYYHHRWLVEITDGRVCFRFKPHLIHASRRLHLPRSFKGWLRDEDRVQWLFWDGSFDYLEAVQTSRLEVERDLHEFVKRSGGANPALEMWDATLTRLKRPVAEFLERRPRLRARVERLFGVDLSWRRKWEAVPEFQSR